RRDPGRGGLDADAPRAEVRGDRPRDPVGRARADPARSPGQPVLPGREPDAEAGQPARGVEGVAAAIWPCREYAVASAIPAPTGTANATARTPYTATGCRISTVPLSSRTATYVTSARTPPYWTWTFPAVSP